MGDMSANKKKKIEYRCEHTERVDPKKLKPHPKNANKHPKAQVRLLADVIQRVGWRIPVIVSKRSGFIVAGHGRQAAAIELGCKAPVDYQDFKDETEELDVLMADNIIPELAVWDDKLRLENLEELKLENIEFNIEVEDFTEDQANSSELPSLDDLMPFHMDTWADSKEEINRAYELLTTEGFHCVRTQSEKK